MISVYCGLDITLNQNSLVFYVKQRLEQLMFNLILLPVIRKLYMISHS